MFNKFGSAPLDSLVEMSEEKRKEWEELDPKYKETLRNNIIVVSNEFSNRLSIEILCHLYEELDKRIKVLENE